MKSLSGARAPVPVLDGRGALCREVLASLPAWFGIPEAVEAYVAAADELPMLACFDSAGHAAGFLSLKANTAVASEVHVMGVKPGFRRRGIGRVLIEAAAEGARFLTVKTLSSANSDPNYAVTRAFYEAVGFLPIEEFPTLWDAGNPCLLMLRPLLDRA
jgi:ribosomal protein S18 acetylase RimI-like enzyme